MEDSSYTELLRYDGAVVERGRRETVVPCALQPRDIEVIRDVWRHKFLTATQLLELHWPGRADAPVWARRRAPSGRDGFRAGGDMRVSASGPASFQSDSSRARR
jgi:hypothetical protein